MSDPGVLTLWYTCTCITFVVYALSELVAKRRHNNVKVTSVFFKIAHVNAEHFKVKLNLFKRWHPKVCKKKNPT